MHIRQMHGDDSRKFLLFKAPTIWEVGKIIYECCLYAVNGNLGKAWCGGSCIRRRKISSNIDRKNQNYAQRAVRYLREFVYPPLLDPQFGRIAELDVLYVRPSG
jgi:hypothetical protein